MKVAGVVMSGGEAKLLIQDGQVTLNGHVERRRAHTVRPGDVVLFAGREYRVCTSPK